MSDLRLAARQIRFENRSFWRNPTSAFFTFVFPLMFLVIFNLLFGSGDYQGFGQTTSVSTFYVPAIAAFAVITATYTNLAITVSFARDEGVLKRVRGTPLPSWAYLAGRIGHSTLMSMLLVVIVTLFGVLFYDVDVPVDKLPAFFVAVIVGAASFSALGLALTGLIPNAEAAPPITNATILPLLFVSDIFIPLEDAPAWLETFAGIFPIKHYSAAMLTAFDPFASGAGFAWEDLAVVAAWGVAGVFLAIRFFSWEPRR